MPNDTRTGLKISVKRSDGGMNPCQRPDLNVIEAAWDHLDSKWNKKHPKKSFGMSFKKPGELFPRTTSRDYKKA